MTKEFSIKLNNNKPFKPVSCLHGLTFYVEDYQRGYKWGNIEITLLLNDIFKHDASKGPYCLQPIIIKPKGEGEFEIIDGQQRITSLYLLMMYLSQTNEIIKYNINYNTRVQSQLFLKDIENFNTIICSDNWQSFITANPEYNNVDIFHFYEVYKSIQKWFEQNKNEISFFKKLIDTLYIIWYDVTKGDLVINSNNKAENIFINFNANKVDLSSSELIKALFILDHEAVLTKEQKKHSAIELALEWDTIENKLQDNTFWYFICNDEKYNKSETRIDFLFDLAVDKVKSREKIETYLEYEKIITSEKAKHEEWKKIKTLFYKLDEWYNDNDMYHYIGYLVATKLTDIGAILLESDKKKKDDFKSILIEKIRIEFNKKKDGEFIYLLEKLNYKEDKDECNNLLLLLNVFYYLKDSSNNKFPFNLFYEHSWSIEHVNPQNPEDINDPNKFEEWIKSIETFNDKGDEDSTRIFKDLIYKLKEICKVGQDKFGELLRVAEIKDAITQVSDLIKVHNIANLALLDRNTNSALGNNDYLVKREIILRFDKDGCYDKVNDIFIPICTRDLFTKTYSYLSKEDVTTYFTAKDMRDYSSYIKEKLTMFLPNQI